MSNITFKGIIHNVLNDAPFIGAILIANTCHRGCTGCINEYLKDDATLYEMTATKIIDEVKKNGLNEGIILSGLEWSEQPNDFFDIVLVALNRDLKIMVYTYLEENEFTYLFPSLVRHPIFIKFGAYLPDLLCDSHFSHGVKLATTNQYIKYFGAINS